MFDGVVFGDGGRLVHAPAETEDFNPDANQVDWFLSTRLTATDFACEQS